MRTYLQRNLGFDLIYKEINPLFTIDDLKHFVINILNLYSSIVLQQKKFSLFRKMFFSKNMNLLFHLDAVSNQFWTVHHPQDNI